MRVPHAFLSLPPSLLLLLATQLLHAQADAGNQKDGPQALPTAVRKMSPDEGEKFMPEYYAFAPADPFRDNPQVLLGLWAREADVSVLTADEEALLATNSSAALAFRPPFPRHYDDRGRVNSDSGSSWGRQREKSPDEEEEEKKKKKKRKRKNEEPWSLYRRTVKALARLRGRQFTCPGGTHACSDIDEPNYCCTDGTTCFVVEDAPDAGNVGCCPDGQTCGGSVAACANGNTACPAEEGGGCCISGFICASIGCVRSTVSTIPSSTTPTQTQTPTSTSTSTITSTTSTTSTTTSTSTTSDGTGLPPVRPTSSSPNTASPITTASPTDYCPTGFYACVASAGSGCCRTGRDCSTTSCPAIASTTIITHGATIVVPLTDAQAAATAGAVETGTPTCAAGWFLCGADAGPVAGCCPSGYACGTASCSLAAATSTDTVQKGRPGASAAAAAAARMGDARGAAVLACAVLASVVLL